MEHLVKILEGRGALSIGTTRDEEADYNLSFLDSADTGLKGYGKIAADPSLLRSAAHSDHVKLQTREGKVFELAVTFVHNDTNSADVEVKGKIPSLED